MATVNLPKIIICERNNLLASSICSALKEHKEFACQAHTKNDSSLMELIAQGGARAVLINPDFLPAIPVDFVKSLSDAYTGCRGIAYYFPESHASALNCIRAGFGGAVSQLLRIHDLEEAIKTVCLGGVYVDSCAETSNSGCEQGRCRVSLSTREQFVLEHVARGHSQKEIARLLSLSIKTIETYKLRGTRKLGLSRKSSIVDYALQNNWLS